MEMKSDLSRDLVNRMIDEIQNKKNIELCDEIFSEAFINHTPPPGFSNNRDGMRQLFSMVHVGFPDGHISIEDQISDGSKVWTRKTFTGTHTGVFGSIPPSGKVVTYQVMDILSVENGKIAEHWSILDRLSLFRPLGVI
jgi:predicted ester cyclase